VPTHGELRLLAVLAQFPDHPLANERAHFVGGADALVDRLVGYYTEVSAGRLTIVPTVGEPVVTLPGQRASYVGRPADLARDALLGFAAAARTPAERAALREAHALVVFFAGPGHESHIEHPDPTVPWSNYTVLPVPVEVEGRRFDDACVIAEEEVAPLSSFGVLCHEFGHQLGLPELYAPGGATHEGIGIWGLMGQGSWLGHGDRPPHLCAWSKARLGWVEVVTIDETTRGVELPAVERVPRVVKIPAGPDRPEEYYLVENRERIGYDAALKGEGALVWHVDERVGGFRSGQANPAHKLLHLVEADGRGDLDRGHTAGGNRGDATDPWQGPSRARRVLRAGLALLGALSVAFAVFRAVRPAPVGAVLARLALAAVALGGAWALGDGPVCGPATPGMAPYGGGPGRVVIRNFSPAGPVMRFDVLVAPAPVS